MSLSSKAREQRLTDTVNAFDAEAHAPAQGLVRELVQFVRHNKKWWLIPILFGLGMLSLVIVLGGTAAAPFIYTLF